MKIGFNEGSNWDCKDHSIMKDLEYCEKYGFDYIEIQSRCLDEELAAGTITIEQISDWLNNHNLKVNSYNALVGFNMKKTEEEKEAVLEELKEDIRRCKAFGTDIVLLVPTEDLDHPATVKEIREDAVDMLRRMLEVAEPEGIRLALEFCGQPNVSISRLEDALPIVEEVDHPLVGLVLDQYHFHAMGCGWDTLEKVDGKKIFVWHCMDTEDLPVAAPYNKYANRLWPGDPRGAMDLKRYADTLKRIGFKEGVCMVEVFRPEYYELSQEENVKQASEYMKKYIETYCKDFD